MAAKANKPQARKGPQKILNCIPSRDTERDWRIEHAMGAGRAGAAAAPPIPPNVDRREPW